MKLFAILLLILFGLSANATNSNDTLKVISWNVFLRPGILCDQQMKRVDSIAYWLKDQKADILVLQEVFHKRARKQLMAILKTDFPHHFGPGGGGLLKTNSGVMIFSRTPLKDENIRPFKYAAGSDQLALKSGLSCSTEWKGKHIQIIGTHLQSGEGEKRDKVRISQQKTLKSMLMDNSDSSYVQILAGDFNTERQSFYYGQMLEVLDSRTIEPTSQLKNTANNSNNPLYHSEGEPELIDYVLLENHSKARIQNILIIEPKANWGGDSDHLSDHRAVVGLITLE